MVLVNKNPATLSYSEFLSVLQVRAYAAVESDSVVRLIPDVNVRFAAVPIVSGDEKHADAEYVTKIIPVKNASAVKLIPVLRPMLPQQAHFVADACSNTIVVVDTFGLAQ